MWTPRSSSPTRPQPRNRCCSRTTQRSAQRSPSVMFPSDSSSRRRCPVRRCRSVSIVWNATRLQYTIEAKFFLQFRCCTLKTRQTVAQTCYVARQCPAAWRNCARTAARATPLQSPAPWSSPTTICSRAPTSPGSAGSKWSGLVLVGERVVSRRLATTPSYPQLPCTQPCRLLPCAEFDQLFFLVC